MSRCAGHRTPKFFAVSGGIAQFPLANPPEQFKFTTNQKNIMRKIKIHLLLAVTLLLSVSGLHAQKMKLESGSLDFLKGVTALNVEYGYDGMMVGKLTEPAYIEGKVAEYNKKEAGKGDQWLKAWQANPATRFQPKFEELLNKQFTERKVALKAGADPAAKYTLILKTTLMEPGWNAGIARHDAEISATATFVETQNRATELAVISISKSPGRGGMGYDFDSGFRVQEAYAKAGKELGAFLAKKLK